LLKAFFLIFMHMTASNSKLELVNAFWFCVIDLSEIY